MALPLPPIPNIPVGNSHEWRDWFFRLYQNVGGENAGNVWNNIDFTGSNITSIKIRQHNSLQGLQGGNDSGTEYYHLSFNDYNRLATPAYGAFSDYTTQPLASTTVGQVMTFNTTDLSSSVSVVSGSQLTVANTGVYNFQWSGQFTNTNVAEQDIYVWLRLNGTDVVGSTGYVSIVQSHGGVQGHVLAGWNFLLSLNAGDYVQLVWGGTSTALSLTTIAAGTSPTRPSTASLIATFTQVS
jgi:hypothetical protein